MRIILATIFILVSTPAVAEWVLIVENEDVKIFADPHTIIKNGNLRRAWFLYNYQIKSKHGERSDEIPLHIVARHQSRALLFQK